jgi:hypothetical protein
MARPARQSPWRRWLAAGLAGLAGYRVGPRRLELTTHEHPSRSPPPKGRAIRVANASPAKLQQVPNAAEIEAALQPVPATIEERMLVLARAANAS